MLLVKNDKPERSWRRARDISPRSHERHPRQPAGVGTIIINFCYNYFVFYDMKWMPDYLKNITSVVSDGASHYFASFMGIAIVALAADGLPIDDRARHG